VPASATTRIPASGASLLKQAARRSFSGSATTTVIDDIGFSVTIVTDVTPDGKG
jgi:hypothetical protein